MKIKFNQNHIKYIFTFIGSIWVIIYIYIIFIRERLPRDIPFDLTELRFWLLIGICFTYLFLIKQTLYPRPMNNIIIQKFLSYIGKPFMFFDSSIKYSKTIYSHYLSFLENSTVKLQTWRYYDYVILIYILQLLPRVLLVSIFIVDVFYLHNISIYYYFILLGLMPLFYRYCRYSLDFAREQFIKYLEERYDKVYLIQVHSYEYYEALAEYNSSGEYSDILDTVVAPHHEESVSVRNYFEIHYDNATNSKENWVYKRVFLAKEEVYAEYQKKHNKINSELTEIDFAIIHDDENKFVPIVHQLYICLELEKTIPQQAYIPIFKTFIYLGYLICWIYILYKSVPTVNNFDTLLYIMEIINKYYAFEEPFTGLHNYNINMYINKSFIKYMLVIVNKYKLLTTLKMILCIMLFKKYTEIHKINHENHSDDE